MSILDHVKGIVCGLLVLALPTLFVLCMDSDGAWKARELLLVIMMISELIIIGCYTIAVHVVEVYDENKPKKKEA